MQRLIERKAANESAVLRHVKAAKIWKAKRQSTWKKPTAKRERLFQYALNRTDLCLERRMHRLVTLQFESLP